MRLWDVGAAACTDTFNHNKAVYCVAAAPGGDGLVAFGGAEKALRVSKEVARAGAHLLGAGAIVAGPQEQAFTVAQGPPASGGIAVALWRCLCHRVSLRGCRLCAARRCCACPRRAAYLPRRTVCHSQVWDPRQRGGEGLAVRACSSHTDWISAIAWHPSSGGLNLHIHVHTNIQR